MSARPQWLTVSEVAGRRAMREWLAVPALVHADDPAWVRVPDHFERRRVSRHAPFFAHGEAALFVAHREGRLAGRISAQINRRHLETHDDATGHFGFCDFLDDAPAATALVTAAADWLRARGLERMVGPVSLSLNEEAGCLVEGFDIPPAVLMPHHRPWTGPLLEGCGLVKEIDLFAHRNPNIELPPRAARFAAGADADPRVAARPLDRSRFREDIALMFEIANDAWRDNWGFVPFSEAEIRSAAKELRPVLSPDLIEFLTLDGVEVGFLFVLPNANEVFARLRPGPLPALDLLRVYAALKRAPPRTFRVPLMGIRRAYQGTRTGGALMGALCRVLGNLAIRHRPDWTEMSWIVETNRPMLRLAEMFGGPPVKRYRLYSMAL